MQAGNQEFLALFFLRSPWIPHLIEQLYLAGKQLVIKDFNKMRLVLNFLGLYTLYSTVIFKSNSTHMTPLGAQGSYLTKEDFEHFLTYIRVDKASGFQTSEGLLPAEHLLTSALFLTEMLILKKKYPAATRTTEENKSQKFNKKKLLMSPFSMALMSGLRRQSVGARMASMPGCSSLRDMAKLVKLYICRKRPTVEY